MGGLQLGDLFFDVGVEGSEKGKGQMDGFRKSIGEVRSVSLEAKAAIVGTVYALQRLFSASSERGMELNRFNYLVASGAKVLQQYQYAARQVGVSNADVAKSFMGLQEIATKAFVSGETPSGMLAVQYATGLDFKTLQKGQQNPEVLLQYLQKYAQSEKNVGLANLNLKSFGITDAMIAALRRGVFTEDNFKKADVYSDRETKNLERAGVAWDNLSNKIEMAIGRLNAKYGTDIVENISKIVDSLIKLSESFIKLAESLKLADKIKAGIDTVVVGIDTANKFADQRVPVSALGPANPNTDINPFPAPKTKTEWVEQKIIGTGADTITSEKSALLQMIAMGIGAAELMKGNSELAKGQGSQFSDQILKPFFEWLTKTTIPNAAQRDYKPGDRIPGLDKAMELRNQFESNGGVPKPPVAPPGAKGVIPGAPPLPSTANVITPKIPQGAQGPSQVINDNRTLSQTNNFNHDAADVKQTGNAVGKAARDAFQTSPARVWGN